MYGLKLSEVKAGEYYRHIASGNLVLVMSARTGLLFDAVTCRHVEVELRDNQLEQYTTKVFSPSMITKNEQAAA